MKEQITNIDNEMLYRYIAGIAEETEIIAVENWILLTDENRKNFEKIKQIWEASGNVRNFISYDSEFAFKEVKKKIKKRKKKKVIKITFNVIKLAAAIILIAGVYLIINLKTSSKNTVPVISVMAQNKQRVVLSDGTEVYLNKGAQINYPKNFTDTVRKIQFIGEAYFNIAKNEKQPFLIITENAQIRVLGTQFNLKTDYQNNKVVVIVAEGKVKFSNKYNKSVFLQKGDKGIVYNAFDKIEKETNADKNFLSWKTGEFDFYNTKLPDALLCLSKYYNKKFKIEKGSLNDFLLTAKYDSLSENDLIEVLELTLNAEIIKTDSLYILK